MNAIDSPLRGLKGMCAVYRLSKRHYINRDGAESHRDNTSLNISNHKHFGGYS